MGKRVVLGGLLAFLVACGGSVDTSGTGPSPSSTAPAPQQGVYEPPASQGPEHVADDVGAPTALAAAGSRVLFTTHATMLNGQLVAAGALFVVDKTAGRALMTLIDRQGASFDVLATDGDTAFVGTSDARLLSVPVVGGAATNLALLDAAATTITVAGDHVYFATKSGAVGRVARKGGPLQALATIAGTVRGLSADDTAVYVATGKTAETAAGILRLAFDGTVTPLASTPEACSMIKDGRNLYWTSLGSSASTTGPTAAKGEVLRLSLDGGDATAVATGAFSACAIASDASSLYFATTLTAALTVKSGSSVATAASLGLMRAPLAGGEPVAIAQASEVLAQPGAVAVDDTHVYWLTGTAVLRLRK